MRVPFVRFYQIKSREDYMQIHTKSRRAFGTAIALFVLLAGTRFLSAQEVADVKKFPSPFILTAAGQSPDVLMVKIVSERGKLDFKYQALAKTPDIMGMKTLVIVMGVSMKGLGSAGIKLDEEVNRVLRLIDDARKNKTAVIGVFAGGAGGRGGRDQLTDSLLAQIAPKVDYLVVIKTGDKDGFLKGIATDNKIPLTYMPAIVDMTKIITGIFN
jgi:hypothetical protein